MSDYDLGEEEYNTRVGWPTFVRILGLVKPHRVWVIGFFFAILIFALVDSISTYLSKQIIDQGIMAGDMVSVLRILLIYGSLLAGQAAGVFGFVFLSGVLGERIRYDLRKKMFSHLQALSLSYYSRTPVGWIMARVTSDSDRVADLMTWGMLDISWAFLIILTSSYFMVVINWQMALIVFAILPVLLLVAIQFRKKILFEFRNVRRMNSRIVGAFNENITGVRVVKALTREATNLGEFGQLTGQMYSSAYRAAWLSAMFLPVVQIISSIALAGIIWISGRQVQIGSMTAGGIYAFVSYITFLMWPIQDAARVFAEMQHAIASAERIFSLIDTQPEIVDRNNARNIQSVRGDIVFDLVNFYYEDHKPVLSDFSLKISQGETVALVGPTGGGKTTIVNLLCRFYEPKRGKILLNGYDYTQLTAKSIQSKIGVVLQTPHLFSGTIRDNIRYGRLDASDTEVEAAAKSTGAHEFISKLEKGYNQEVGESGDLLSVGQKQLISLARAVLSQPEIFIMDEATSSVDTLTEATIQRGMETLMKDRTSIIIAHRLSTIRKADKIVVVEQGRIAEMGTHAELLRLKGKYYRLYTQQFRHELEQAYDSFLGTTKTDPIASD